MAVKYVKEFEFGGSVSHKKPPGMKKDLAPAKPERGEYQGYAKGGSVPVRGQMSTPVKKPVAPPVRKPVAAPARQVINNRGNFGPTPGMKTEPPKMGAASSKPVSMPQKKVPLGQQSQVMGLGSSDMYGMGKAPMAQGLGGTYGGVGQTRALKKGGMAKGEKKVSKVMGEYKRGELHSGSKKGPVVKNPKQAMAIALSEARKAGAKIPKKAEGGEIFSTEYMAYGDKKVPYRGSPKKGKKLGRQDRRAREAMERAEKFAPGLSLDMRAKGGMPVHRRKPMYGGGKC